MLYKLFFIFKTSFILFPLTFWFVILNLIISSILYREHMLKKRDCVLNNEYVLFNDDYKDYTFKPLFKMLNFYYNKNIYIECIKLLYLFGITIGFLLILRLLNFGKSYTIWYFILDKNTCFYMLIMFIFMMLFFIYLKLLGNVLSDLISHML